LLQASKFDVLPINPAKVHDFPRIEGSLKEFPANVQEFLSFLSKKRAIAHKSCIIAGFFNYGSKTGKNDVFSHHFWIASKDYKYSK